MAERARLGAGKSDGGTAWNPTRAEALLWQALKAKRADGFKFRRQHAFGRFVVDFYCPAANLVIELDGDVHAGQVDADRERQYVLERLGLRVIRFNNESVLLDLGSVLDSILAAARQHS